MVSMVRTHTRGWAESYAHSFLSTLSLTLEFLTSPSDCNLTSRFNISDLNSFVFVSAFRWNAMCQVFPSATLRKIALRILLTLGQKGEAC